MTIDVNAPSALVHHGARTVAVVAASLLLLSGCGSDEAPRPLGAATQSASPAPGDEPLPCAVGVEPFAGTAAAQFGAERVMAAYCFLVELVEAQTRSSLARPIPGQRTRDVAALSRHLTSGATRGWATLVRARASGDEAASRRVDGLTLHDVRDVPREYVGADDTPSVYGTEVGPASARPARGGEALEMSFTVETGLVLERPGDTSGRHSLLPVTRTATYVLVVEGDRWRIQDWEAEFEHGQVRLVSRPS